MYTGPYVSRAAEKCLFRELFTNPATVHANGGTLVGSPVPNRGLPLNGTSQYATYAIGATDLTRDEINIEVVFTPDFAADDGVNHFLFDTTDNHRYLVVKDLTNQLNLYLGHVSVATVALGSYSAYWNQGEQNRLLISSNGTTTDAWLNGTQIVTAAAVGWTPKNPTTIYVGARLSGIQWFDGTIHSIDFRAGLLTAADVAAIEDGSLFAYMSRCSLALDFSTATAQAGTIRGTTELITDGDMSNPASWTCEEGSSITGGKLVVDGSQTGTKRAYQDAGFVIGKKYRLRYTVSDYVTGILTPYVGNAGMGTSITANGHYDEVIDAAGSSLFYLAYNIDFIGKIDDVSVVETDELLSDSDMEATGVGKWTAISGATLTKEVGTRTGGSGSQILQVSIPTTDAYGAARAVALSFTVGRVYRFTGWAKGDGVNAVPRLMFQSSVDIWLGTNSATWQYFDVTMAATQVFLDFGANGNVATTDLVQWDDVQVCPVLARTLDKSPAGRVCLLGDGYTAATQPAFIGRGSFSFDGANQYMQILDGSFLYEDALTLAFVFRADYAADSGTQHFLCDDTIGAGLHYAVIKKSDNTISVYNGTGALISIPLATYSPYWRVNGLNVLVLALDGSTKTVRLNGNVIHTGGTYGKLTVNSLNLWRRTNDTQFHSGRGEGFYAFPLVLSPVQQDDFLLSLGVTP